MTTEQQAQLVRRWFEKAEQIDGPLLPDGWFGGRPRDNTFFLEDVQVDNDVLTILLDGDTTLRFDRPGRVFVENSDLVFEGFRRASLRWKHYGGGATAPYHEKQYDSGQIRFAAPIGTTIGGT